MTSRRLSAIHLYVDFGKKTVALCEKGLRLVVEQYDERVDPDRRSDRESEQVEDAQDDGQDARPLPPLQEADAGDDARDREDEKKDGERRPDEARDEERLPIAGDQPRPTEDAEQEQAEDDQDRAGDDVDEAEDLDVSVHAQLYTRISDDYGMRRRTGGLQPVDRSFNRLPVARLPVARLPVARLPVARLPVA